MDSVTLAKHEKSSRSRKGKKWIWWAVCLLVLAIAAIMIGVFSIHSSAHSKGANSLKRRRISLEKLLTREYDPVLNFNGTWISDHEFVYESGDDTILYNLLNSTRTKVSIGARPGAQIFSMQDPVSPDQNYLLIHYINQSKMSLYASHRTSGEEIKVLADDMVPFLQFLSWGKKGTQVLFVLNGNIYYKASLSEEPFQITRDAVIKELSYDFFDAAQLSEDGEMLFYVRVNMSEVGDPAYLRYGSYSNKSNVYPEVVRYREPRPGLNISENTLWLFNLGTYEKIEILPPQEHRDRNLFPATTTWAGASAIAVSWSNRFGNFVSLALCKKADSWRCHTVYQEHNKKGWLDFYYYPYSLFLTPDEKNCFVILSSPQGSSGSYKHIAHLNLKTKSKRFLTSGRSVVEQLVAYDSVAQTLYYISTREDKPGERHLFSLRRDGRVATCHTCNGSCLHNLVTFKHGKPLYYTRICNGPVTPNIEIYRTKDHALMAVWENNEKFRNDYEELLLPDVRHLKVPIEGGYEAIVRLYLPPSLEPGRKYPLVMATYGGPGSQEITETVDLGWGQFLTTTKDVVYAKMDGRGTRFQSDELMFEIFQRLGTVEIEDRITVAKYLLKTFDYIDPERVAIWGHSYGGYAAAMTLASESDVFKCAIGRAPVTNWRNYDQGYTEKYLGSLEDNEEGYERANLLNKVENMKGKKFLLIHGLADDNVNFQNSALLTKALVDKGIRFRLMVYPDADHSLRTDPTQHLHLFRLMEEFLMKECFSQVSS